MKNTEARTLLKQYAAFIRKLVARFNSSGLEYEERHQVACIAFLRSAQAWEPSRSGKSQGLAAWAMRPIMNALSDACAKHRAQGLNLRGRRVEGRKGSAIQVSMEGKVINLSAGNKLVESRVAEGDESMVLVWHDVLGTFEEPPDWLALRRLPDAVASLSAREAHVLRAKYLNDMSYEEIASEMKVTRQGVQAIEARALRRLREILGDQSDAN